MPTQIEMHSIMGGIDTKRSVGPSMKLLRWAGSKSQSAGAITPYLDFQKKYVEAFCGSASFFFSNRPAAASLNDSNPDLINFYRDIAAQPKEVWERYSKIPDTRDSYNSVRATYNGLEPCTEKSSYFLFLNHYCFNGIYRTNRAGSFNTPYGKHGVNKSKMPWEQFQNFASQIGEADLHCNDFEAFLTDANFQDCSIYLDPPYFTNEERVFIEYGQKSFKSSDLQRLRDIFYWLAKENLVVLTYKNCAEFRAAFSDKIVSEIPITRNIGGFAGRRKKDSELVAVAGPA